MHGLGPIDPEPNEPVFHEEWERRMFGVMIGMFAGGHFNVDEFRHGIERMAPADYLSTSYYEHWLHTVETLLVEKDVLTRAELDARRAKLEKEAA
jgi:nitrile hydratase